MTDFIGSPSKKQTFPTFSKFSKTHLKIKEYSIFSKYTKKSFWCFYC